METPKSKLSLGVSLVVLGLILILGRSPTNVATENTFANEPVKVEGFNQTSESFTNYPERIVIPGAGIDLPVKKADIVRGYWEVFDDSAGWGGGSGLPGQIGNQVIFAHARQGLFLPLKNVHLGDRVYVLAAEGWFSYIATDIKEVYPSQVEVIKPTDDETLTLYTCSGYQDTKRLIVVAKRVTE
ncbi:MAG: Sortase family protein [Candidatus Woesebacteria bacterium GW2011_GWA1_39_8]|jgi:sortase A|uniref:Sortase family protein n=1 Tax=Candidatus Woesebacteria bacterium GW2011_GWA1_39_8 TaxID=1618552 RepID=A0A0G0PLI3_9BACT|nr:MAG: Sortase family protein [Candidatus Woesebacteria bacterium GW2011_GWA1_39_8]